MYCHVFFYERQCIMLPLRVTHQIFANIFDVRKYFDKKHDNMFSHFDRTHKYDRQTSTQNYDNIYCNMQYCNAVNTLLT